MVVMLVGVERSTLKNFFVRTFNKTFQILTEKTIFSDVKFNFNLSPTER